MNGFNENETYPIKIKPYALALAVIWSAIIVASLLWNVYQSKKWVADVARIQARNSFIKDITYRRWNAGHGGVYVPVTDKTPSNPYLKVFERDITTPSGVMLTLMNPAYMTRQVHELTAKTYGIQGHITSLSPIRPANAPDPWETQALKAFQDGAGEISSIKKEKNETFMRLMRPLITEEGCLKCHAEQGYKVGDIRGGISESVPMSSLWAVERSHLLTLFMGHCVLWLVGLLGIGLVTSRLGKQVAERKKAEEARQLTQFAIDHFSEAAFWMSSDARFIYVNEAACHALGYSEEELLQMTVHDIDPDFPQEVWPDHWTEIKRRGSFIVESRHRTKEGRIFPVEITVNFLEFGGKEFNCAFAKDITERKQAEEALRESEAALRSIFRAAPTGIGVVIDRVIKRANDKLCEMLGYSREEMLDKSARMFYQTDEDFEYVGREKYRLIGERGTGTVETRWLCKDGKVIDVLLSSTPIDPDDLSKGVTFTALDITSRKQAEKALAASEQRFRELAELLPETIFEMDAKGLLTFVNRNAFNHFGFTPHDFDRGLNGFDLIFPRDRQKAIDNAMKVLNGEDLGINEYTALRKDGTTFPALFHSTAIIREGKPVGLRGFVIDISDTKQLEAQLQQSHKMEAIGTLTGGIAHDFNNILSIIIGNTELAMDDVPEWNPARYNIEEVLTASLRAKDVVRQLLSFARRTKLEKKLTNIAPIVTESLQLLRSSIPTSIEIRDTIQNDVDTILADPTQINQVLINLCTNADHAMPDGGIIEVKLKNIELDEKTAAKYPELTPGRYVNLTVSDTGQGISWKEIDRIYDPYFTTKEVGKGTGMGLAVVHGIVKGHNGAITVESESGKGTTFSIYFPAVEKEPVVEIETDKELPTGNESILFVDDEKSIVTIAQKILERLGYQVKTEISSLEALERFRSEPDRFDLVITDMTMPNMTGDKLVKEILSIRKDIPIILCTGFSEKITEKRAKELCIRSFVLKPLDKRDFAITVRNVLDEK